jgi:hypothetical protein
MSATSHSNALILSATNATLSANNTMTAPPATNAYCMLDALIAIRSGWSLNSNTESGSATLPKFASELAPDRISTDAIWIEFCFAGQEAVDGNQLTAWIIG